MLYFKEIWVDRVDDCTSSFSLLLQLKFRWTHGLEDWTNPLQRLMRAGNGPEDASQPRWTKPAAVGSFEIWRYRPEDRETGKGGLRGEGRRDGAAETGAAGGARRARARRGDRPDPGPLRGADRGQPLPGRVRPRRARRGGPARPDRRRPGDALP